MQEEKNEKKKFHRNWRRKIVKKGEHKRPCFIIVVISEWKSSIVMYAHVHARAQAECI